MLYVNLTAPVMLPKQTEEFFSMLDDAMRKDAEEICAMKRYIAEQPDGGILIGTEEETRDYKGARKTGVSGLVAFADANHIPCSHFDEITIPQDVYLEVTPQQWQDIEFLFSRIITRNNRLSKLIEVKTPEIIIQSEELSLNKAVAQLESNRGDKPLKSPDGHTIRSLNDVGYSLIGGWESQMAEAIEMENRSFANLTISEAMASGDSEHQVLPLTWCDDGSELHRFNNKFGTPCSAIYCAGTEFRICHRDIEAEMIFKWQNTSKEARKFMGEY